MDQNQLYDTQTVAVMKRVLHKNANCIDIDCHVGVFLDEFCDHFRSGRRYYFLAS